MINLSLLNILFIFCEERNVRDITAEVTSHGDKGFAGKSCAVEESLEK
jgi:hypothetical protein